MPEQTKKTEWFLPGCPLWVDESTSSTITFRNISWCTVESLVLIVGSKTIEKKLLLAPGESTCLTFDEDISQFVIDSIVTEDGVCWKNREKNWGLKVQPAEVPDATQEYYSDFLSAWQGTTPLVLPAFFDTYWRCGCGQINDIARTFCGKCQREKIWVKEHMNGAATVATAKRKVAEDERRRLDAEKIAAIRARKRRKIFSWIGFGTGTVATLIIITLIVSMIFIPARTYAEGKAYLELDRYHEAYVSFSKLKNYRDCPQLLTEISRKLCMESSLSAGERHIVKNNRQGKVTGVGYALEGAMMTDKWNAIRAVSAGKAHTLGLHYSGTVIAVGNKENGACDVSSWNNMAQVGAGDQFSVGLKNDGTVMATGKNNYGQCKVNKWTGISAISVGPDYVLGLKNDGTVIAAGNNKNGQCNVSDWRDIVFIAAGNSHAVGVRNDGTVVATGNNQNKACDVSDWNDIIALTAGNEFTVGLKRNGTLVATGKNDKGQITLDGIESAIAVVSGWDFTIVISDTGTPVFLGTNANGESGVEHWELSI